MDFWSRPALALFGGKPWGDCLERGWSMCGLLVQTSIGTVWRETLGRLLRERVEHVWTFGPDEHWHCLEGNLGEKVENVWTILSNAILNGNQNLEIYYFLRQHVMVHIRLYYSSFKMLLSHTLAIKAGI